MKIVSLRLFNGFFIFTCFSLFFSSFLGAAELDGNFPISQGEEFLNVRENERNDKGFVKKKEQKKKKKTLDIKDSKCIQINKVLIEGVSVLPLKSIRKIVQPLEGSCVGPKRLNSVIGEINETYIDSGFITTRAYLPKQKIGKEKILKLLVLEGVIESIELNENKGADFRKKIMAFPVGLNEKLQLRKLEQGLDQLNRVRSSNAKLKLWPGEKNGGSKVKITNVPTDETRGYLTFDNGGQKASGERRIRFGLEKDNLLGINDSFSLYYIGSRDTNALAFEFSTGYKNWDLGYSWSNSEYVSFLTDSAELYGLSDTYKLSAKYLYNRNSTTKSKLTLDLVARDPRRFINDVELTPVSSGHIRLGVEKKINEKNKRIQLSAGISRGLNLLSGSTDLFEDNFVKFDLGFTDYGKLGDRWKYKSSLNLQYSLDSLLSSEQVNIGSLHSVRGFKGTPLSGDSGFYLRNTGFYSLDCSNFNKIKRICQKTQPRLFLDLGYTYSKQGNRFGDKHGWLNGAGAGVKYDGKNLDLDLGIAQGFGVSNDSIDEGTNVYLTATYKIF